MKHRMGSGAKAIGTAGDTAPIKVRVSPHKPRKRVAAGMGSRIATVIATTVISGPMA